MEKTFTAEKYQEIVKAVEALPKEAIERANKEITRKGYDTTGYQYQFLVNVLNEVVGVSNWGFVYETNKEIEGKWANGKPYWEITVDMTVEILGAQRKCVGGHKAEMHADAKKGAITNGLKKTLALFGVGKKAYEGTLDDDYRPIAPKDTATGQIRGNKSNPAILKARIDKLMTAIFKMPIRDLEDYKHKIKELTQLDLREENFEEIADRLSVIYQQSKEK